MTFIASVVAKKGAVVIADSLVTTMEKVLNYDAFKAYCTEAEGSSLKPEVLDSLFNEKASYTKGNEEKIFAYDKYTAVAVAGSVLINNKTVEELIHEIIRKNKLDKSYQRKNIEQKVGDFYNFLIGQVAEHLKRSGKIRSSIFLFTHYDTRIEQAIIYRIKVASCSIEESDKQATDYVSYQRMTDFHKVVCAGQNRISRRILFGEMDFFNEVIPKVMGLCVEKLGIEREHIPIDFMQVISERLPPQFYEDMKIRYLENLTLQQAADLALLLMMIETKFQNYTEKIPQVGGTVKLAVIDKDGFRFVTGHEILKSVNQN
jgi:hypothetical protein